MYRVENVDNTKHTQTYTYSVANAHIQKIQIKPINYDYCMTLYTMHNKCFLEMRKMKYLQRKHCEQIKATHRAREREITKDKENKATQKKKQSS